MHIHQWGDTFEQVSDKFVNAVLAHSGNQFYQIDLDFSELNPSKQNLTEKNTSEFSWSKSNFEMDAGANKNLAIIKDRVISKNTSIDVFNVLSDESFDKIKMTVDNKHIKQLICFPLNSNEQSVFGTVSLFDYKSLPLHAEQVLIIKLLVRNLALDIDVLKSKMELNAIYSSLNKQLNEQLDEFIQIASHDLHSPLNAIENILSWIEEDVNEGITEDNTKHFGMVKTSINRMHHLLSSLSDYSRIQRSEIKPEILNLKAMVFDICEELDVPSSFKIDVDNCQLESPKKPVKLFLKYLIDNAIKHHNKQSGVININCISNKSNYILSIIDDGPGVPEKFHDKIFKPFQTLKSKDEIESSGLGLASVKRILKLYGGNISINSKVDAGTEFIVDWPKFEPPCNNSLSSIDAME